MIHRWFARFAVLGFCSCLARPACAEVSVLIITPADDALDYSVYESRLRSELLTAGFAVSAERVPGTPSYASVASNAERAESQAAIAISVADGELCGLLWIADPSASPGLMRPVRCCPLGDDAALVFAVRATDALNAGLLELHYPRSERQQSTPAAPPPAQAPPAQASKPPAPAPVAPRSKPEPAPAPAAPSKQATPRTWNAQASGAVAAWLRQFPVTYGAKVELTRDLSHSWSAGLQGLAFGPASIRHHLGKASVSQFLVGAVVRYRTALTGRLSVVDALGAGVYGISAEAQAEEPYPTRHAFSVTGSFSFDHQVHVRLARPLSAVAGVTVAAPWTQYSLIVVDTTVARAAAPLFVASLGLELHL